MKTKTEQFKIRVENALKHKRRTIARPDLTRAAVLVPIVFKTDEPHLILTKRTMTVATHKGQISFPGGMREPDDKDEIDNALRETREEIGLHSHKVAVIGLLDDFITTSGFVVTPVVGFVTADAPLTPDPMEVAEIILAPVSDFTNPTYHELVTEKENGVSRKYHSYRVGKHLIWGATAGIIHQFLSEMDALEEAV